MITVTIAEVELLIKDYNKHKYEQRSYINTKM